MIFFNNKQEKIAIAWNDVINKLGELYHINNEIIDEAIIREKNVVNFIETALKTFLNTLNNDNESKWSFE